MGMSRRCGLGQEAPRPSGFEILLFGVALAIFLYTRFASGLDAQGYAGSIVSTGIPVLVVEDEPSVRNGLCDLLRHRGFAPFGVSTGEEGVAEVEARRYDLVLLDLGLPGADGLVICRTLRATFPRLPILILTARDDEKDIVAGLSAGSDDYVTKPFSTAELVARVEALLRRTGAFDPGTAQFSFGPWSVDPPRLRARRGGETVELTRRELELLALLRRERGRIVSRRTLLREVWQLPAPERTETRTVDVHVAKLRKKLGRGASELIETVFGEGYRFNG